MKFSLDNLTKELIPIQSYETLVLAISGGLDSMVLLHALSELVKNERVAAKIRAVHVNHRLHKDADNWEIFCVERCAALNVPVKVKRFEKGLLNQDESNLEYKARKERYKVFESVMGQDCCLLLAHHLDDQLETLFFRLNRGAGLKGLTAVPQDRELGSARIFRPLLGISRESLKQYAENQKLQWVEDNSNDDVSYDRNFLRHEILPKIEKRWPNYRKSWSKSLKIISDAHSILEEAAATDLSLLSSQSQNKLSLDLLMLLPKERQRNVIKYWVGKIAKKDIGWNKLHYIVNEALPFVSESNIEIEIDDYLIRSFRNQLHLFRRFEQLPEECDWDLGVSQKLSLKNNGILLVEEAIGRGFSRKLVDKVKIRFREGGETFRMLGRPRKSLKKIFQETQIEPWLRSRIPLIYCKDELICVVGIGISEKVLANQAEAGFLVSWCFPQD